MKKNFIWWLVFITAAGPSVYLFSLYLFSPRSLGIDPIEVLLAETGEWALRFLLITLCCSPLRRLGIKSLARFRRMLGLYSFYYATLHLALYIAGWIQWDLAVFVEDLISRPFIYIGMAAWLVLTALAVTSPKAMIKKLKKRWVVIHRFIYVGAVGALVHLWMQSRGSLSEFYLYGVIFLLLMAERFYRSYWPRLLARYSSA